MVKKAIFVLCIVLTSFNLYAADLNEGNNFLKAAKYDEAISNYESIVKDGYIGFELFFNLGTAYSKKGDFSNAIFNFEKALRIKPLNKLARYQLVQLNLKLRDKPSIYEDTGLLGWLKRIQFSLGIDAWAALSIFFMLLVPMAIFISYKYRQLKYRSIIFLSSVFWFLLSGFSVLMARNGYHFKYLQEEAIIFPESIKVFSEPNNSSTILYNFHQGTKVEIIDSTANMYYVQYSEKKGWINDKEVQKIRL